MSVVIALVAAAALTPFAARLGRAIGLLDRPEPVMPAAGEPLKIHAAPIPITGGLAVAAAFLIAVPAGGAHLHVGLAVALLIALTLGMVDDVRPLPSGLRIAMQLVVGAALLADGADPAVALGLVLVLVCTNAVNLIDGQDGLAAGLGAIAAGGLALLGHAHGAHAATAPALALAGALAGFLLWNRPPASIFLGDGGAYAAGAVLAGTTAIVARDGGWQPALGALVCLGVFFFEIAFTIVRRLPSGRLTVGDRLHSYDILSARLGSRSRVMLVFWALGAACVGAGAGVAAAPPAGAIAIAAAVLVSAAVAGRRLWASRPAD